MKYVIQVNQTNECTIEVETTTVERAIELAREAAAAQWPTGWSMGGYECSIDGQVVG